MIKTHIKRAILIFGALAFISLGTPKSANAYIDPGSSSYIFQMLIAGFLGASVGVKMFWKQISAKIKDLFPKSSNDKDKEKRD